MTINKHVTFSYRIKDTIINSNITFPFTIKNKTISPKINDILNEDQIIIPSQIIVNTTDSANDEDLDDGNDDDSDDDNDDQRSDTK